MSTEAFLGSMVPFAGNFTIRDFVMCNGGMIQINQFQALFSLLGTTYGGDARTTFAAPDLRGRSPIGYGQGIGLSLYPLGAPAGNEKANLQVDNLAPHTHQATFTPTGGASSTLQVATNPANTNTPDEDCYLAAGSSAMYFKPSAFAPVELIKIKGLSTNDGVNHREVVGLTETDNLSPNIKGMSIGDQTNSGGIVEVKPTGQGKSFSVLNPVLAINWLLSTNGIYPSRI